MLCIAFSSQSRLIFYNVAIFDWFILINPLNSDTFNTIWQIRQLQCLILLDGLNFCCHCLSQHLLFSRVFKQNRIIFETRLLFRIPSQYFIIFHPWRFFSDLLTPSFNFDFLCLHFIRKWTTWTAFFSECAHTSSQPRAKNNFVTFISAKIWTYCNHDYSVLSFNNSILLRSVSNIVFCHELH